jgi:uncharacterized protein (DUF433 family)
MPRDHLSIRLPPETIARVRERSVEYGEPLTKIVERYIEEGLRLDRHPGIVFVDGPTGRRARLAGTRLDVSFIVEVLQDNEQSIEETAAYLELPLWKIEAARRYYGEFQTEIDERIALLQQIEHREEAAYDAAQAALESRSPRP